MGYDMEKSLGYVMENGSVMDTYKLEFLFELGRDDKIPIDFMKKYQGKDGGFAYEFKSGNPTSVATTISIFPWYNDLDLTYTGTYKRCVNFLLECQDKEGAWDENYELNKLNPPELYQPNILSTKMFLTSRVINELLYYDINAYSAKKGLLYLENFRRKDGSFEGFPITNWMLFSIYNQLNMEEKAESLIPHIRNNIEKDTRYVIWYLECIWKSKRENLIAEKLLNWLEDHQEKDGSWKTVEGKRHYPDVTVEVIKTLKRWGR